MLIEPWDVNNTQSGSEGCIARAVDKFSVFHYPWETFRFVHTKGELSQLHWFVKLAEVVDSVVVLVRLAGQAQALQIQLGF